MLDGPPVCRRHAHNRQRDRSRSPADSPGREQPPQREYRDPSAHKGGQNSQRRPGNAPGRFAGEFLDHRLHCFNPAIHDGGRHRRHYVFRHDRGDVRAPLMKGSGSATKAAIAADAASGPLCFQIQSMAAIPVLGDDRQHVVGGRPCRSVSLTIASRLPFLGVRAFRAPVAELPKDSSSSALTPLCFTSISAASSPRDSSRIDQLGQHRSGIVTMPTEEAEHLGGVFRGLIRQAQPLGPALRHGCRHQIIAMPGGRGCDPA